jgi:hypothetical protein
VLENGTQNGIQVEARSERTRQLVEDKQVFQRDTVFLFFFHMMNLWSILSHRAGKAIRHSGHWARGIAALPESFAQPPI